MGHHQRASSLEAVIARESGCHLAGTLKRTSVYDDIKLELPHSLNAIDEAELPVFLIVFKR